MLFAFTLMFINFFLFSRHTSQEIKNVFMSGKGRGGVGESVGGWGVGEGAEERYIIMYCICLHRSM